MCTIVAANTVVVTLSMVIIRSLLIFLFLGSAWAEPPILSPESYNSFQILAKAGMSGRIAFSSKIEGSERILLLDLDTLKIRPVVTGPGNNSYPSWSGDGSKIAFVSDRDGNKEIYTSDWDGGRQQRITNNKYVDDNPAFSPNSSSIAYYSEDQGRNTSSNLYLFDLNQKASSKLTTMSTRNTVPKWSPDNSKIVYSTSRAWPGWDVCIFNLQTKADTCVMSGYTSFCRAEFSHSGEQLVYSFGALNQVDLGIYTLKNRKFTPLTKVEGKEYDAIWSYNDKFVYFTSDRESRNIFNLYMIEVETGLETLLLKSPFSIRHLSFTPVKTMEVEARRLRELQG